MAHVMIDLETWGVTPGSALRSLGAVVFDPTSGDLGSEFYANITDESCEAFGLHKDLSTVNWWAVQSATAQQMLLVDQKPLADVLADFTAWWAFIAGEQIWGHGASFDPVLLESAYSALCLEAPWKFWNVRCCRTILACGNRRPQPYNEGEQHNALDDAKAQAKAVAAAFRYGKFCGI